MYVKNYYYGEMPENLDTLTSVKEITDALDAHSYYMPKNLYEMYVKLIGMETISDTRSFQSLRSLQSITIANTETTNHITSELLYGNTGS